MTLEEFIKKLGLAIEDEGIATELKKFGIEPEQIEGFKDLTVPTTLDEALKIKGVQSEFDKKLQKAADTREAKLKLKYGFGEEGSGKDPEEEEDIDVKDPAMKAVLAQMKKMSEKLETFEKEKAQETQAQKQQRAKDYLKSKNIPGVYVHEMDLEKDFEEQFEAISEKVKEDGVSIETTESNPRQTRIPVPNNGGVKKPSKEDIAKIVG